MKRLPIFALLFLLAACQGPTGPVGPPGADGEDGAVGMVSESFTIPAGAFTDSGTVESYSRAMPRLTSAVAAGGIVVAYTNLGSAASSLLLPLSLPLVGNTVVLSYRFEAGTFTLLIVRAQGPAAGSLFTGDTIRVVVIPP